MGGGSLPAATDDAATAAPGTGAQAVYRKITAGEAHDMMTASAGFILLDVRGEDEYNTEHIAGAVLMPVDRIAGRAEAELPDRNQLLFVYCRSGVRSERAAKTLVGMGYTNVHDIGGIIDWPYETVIGTGEDEP